MAKRKMVVVAVDEEVYARYVAAAERERGRPTKPGEVFGVSTWARGVLNAAAPECGADDDDRAAL